MMPKYVVLTGGPGAGKTAVLEMIRNGLCPHVAVLPEAASIIFKGGFLREPSLPGRKAAQRAIFHVQREHERIFQYHKDIKVVLCDRGTLDGLAYWPNSILSFFEELETKREHELKRYATVIHLRSPNSTMGYNHENPDRIEQAEEAARIDDKILEVWEGHPARFFVNSNVDFIKKAHDAIELLKRELPTCCAVKF